MERPEHGQFVNCSGNKGGRNPLGSSRVVPFGAIKAGITDEEHRKGSRAKQLGVVLV